MFLVFSCVSVPAPAEEIDICSCENEEKLSILENVDENGYNKIAQYFGDLLCSRFESNRVDNRFRIDLVVCSKDANI
jgi:hypothetical protein